MDTNIAGVFGDMDWKNFSNGAMTAFDFDGVFWDTEKASGPFWLLVLSISRLNPG